MSTLDEIAARDAADARDDEETLTAFRERWAARPTGQGTTFARLVEHLGLTDTDERDALSASIQRLIVAGKVARVPDTVAERFRLTEWSDRT